MEQERKRISDEQLKAIGTAWSLESREGHEAEERTVIYIGSRAKGYLDGDPARGIKVVDYYQDDTGAYWYENRALLPNGRLVSMEVYLFGRELKTKKRVKNS